MDTYNEETALPILKGLKDWTFKDSGIEKKFVFKLWILTMKKRHCLF